MKKIYIGIILTIFVTIFAACSRESARDFISFDDNLLLTFDVDGVAPFVFQVFNSYTTNNRLQRRLPVSAEQIMVELLEIQGDELVLIDIEQHMPENINLTGRPAHFHEVILAGPISLGNSWIHNPFDPPEDHRTREITGINISVTTPAGTFDTIEVTTFPPYDPNFVIQPRMRDYFAKGVGVVKSISHSGVLHGSDAEDTQTTVRLINIQHMPLTERAPIFHIEDGEWVFSEIEINYTTNNDLTEVLAQVARRTLEAALGHNSSVDINFAITNPANRGLNLDFCAHFAAEMAQAADYEQERNLLNAIASSFSILFNATGVRITVDGQPYSSGRITFGAMEFIPAGQGIWQ